ncbi:SH3 domain-containing protein [Aureispira sp. CCB-QB1]|uniref:SH3 domain-containing protein n=2 Tax=unclassified Aureispira TaxID=2649989 RepID=UPI0012DCC66B|nr:SH3 domain-containing protein [Aureispira sp. CCB-QB1]
MRVLFLYLFFWSFSIQAQLIQDESYLDESFWIFKNKLEASILTEDKEAFKKCLADNIILGGYACDNDASSCSKEEVMKSYFENDANAAESWNALRWILRFGFKRMTKSRHIDSRIIKNGIPRFQAPSFKTKIDEENELIVLGERVNIREEPSLNAKVIRQASYEVFACDCNSNTHKKTTYQEVDGIGWMEIKLKNGKVGYIAAKYGSNIESRELTVAKIKGEWKIISFFMPLGC